MPMNSTPPAKKKNLKRFLIFFSGLPDLLCKLPVSFEVSRVTVISEVSFIRRLLIHLTLHLGSTCRLQGGCACLKFLTSSDDHEDGGHKEQRSPSGENQAANHCP